MKPAKIVLFYGMGGAFFEWWSDGEQLLRKRLIDLGAEVQLLGWNQRTEAHDFFGSFTGFRGLIGDSLGAGSAAQYASDLNGPVDFVGGFQPSMDDMRAEHGIILVSPNVVRAHCVYDPIWADTLGLGQAQYEITPGSSTILLTTQHRAMHPDDAGYSQNIIFNEVRELTK